MKFKPGDKVTNNGRIFTVVAVKILYDVRRDATKTLQYFEESELKELTEEKQIYITAHYFSGLNKFSFRKENAEEYIRFLLSEGKSFSVECK